MQRNFVFSDRLAANVATPAVGGDDARSDAPVSSATGFCPCHRPGCFSFTATHDPHVVILCDCKDWWVTL
jgi:hypothetical protein